MVPRRKKLAYSFAAAMAGVASFVLLAGMPITAARGMIGVFSFGIAGWVIAIPLVLKVNNISGWRFWLYLGIGGSYGPIILFFWFLLPGMRHVTQSVPVLFLTLIMMLGVLAVPFFVGTLAYLLWLRKAQKSAMRRMELATVSR
jgi:hypothetical protein